MSNDIKMEEENLEGFTFGLAAVDMIPCFEFLAACILISIKLKSPIFVIGFILAFLAGAGKVAWKLVLAAKKVDVPFLRKQFGFAMPGGFVLMVIGFALGFTKEGAAWVISAMLTWQGLIFAVLILVCAVAMFWCRKHLKQSDSKNNWLEQTINIVFQGSFLLCIIYVISMI